MNSTALVGMFGCVYFLFTLFVVSTIFFQELLGASRVVASGSLGKGARAAKDTVKDKVEDVQEAWETSQVRLLSPTNIWWCGCTEWRSHNRRLP